MTLSVPASVAQGLVRLLAERTGRAPTLTSSRSVTGGCINSAACIDTDVLVLVQEFRNHPHRDGPAEGPRRDGGCRTHVVGHGGQPERAWVPLVRTGHGLEHQARVQCVTGDRPWVVAGILAVWGLAAPMSLQPVYRQWMKLGLMLSRITTPLILGIVFYGLILPMGLVMRLMGRDPMARRFDNRVESYRVQHPKRPRENVERPF